jgi:hypothetical protein
MSNCWIDFGQLQFHWYKVITARSKECSCEKRWVPLNFPEKKRQRKGKNKTKKRRYTSDEVDWILERKEHGK